MRIDQQHRLRVLVNGLSARNGGVQTYLVNMLKFLPEDLQADIYFLAPRDLAIPQRSNLICIPVPQAVDNPLLRTVWERICVPRLTRDLDIDVLFCPGGIVGGKVSNRCSTVVMFRNMLPFDRVQRKAFRLGYARWRHWLLERVLMRSMLSADCVIFISDFARKVIEARAGRPLRNAVVVPHGINPAFRASNARLLPRPGIVGENPYLLYVSNLDPYKSHIEVVRAYSLIKQRGFPEKLVLVGNDAAWDPNYGRRVRREIERLGLAQDVLLTGTIRYDAMPEYYAHAKLILFASRCENCPNILLEALAAGKPIVCSNYQPMPEFAGDAAVYFDPTSPQDICDKTCEILSNSQQIEKLSKAALERSLLFDWHRTAMMTWKTIETISAASSTDSELISDRERPVHASVGEE